MNLQRILFFLGMAFWGHSLFAQQLQSVDLLYLEGGNFVQGTIIDSLSDENWVVVDLGGDTPLPIARALVTEIRHGNELLRTNRRGQRVATTGHFFETASVFMTGRTYSLWNETNRINLGAEFSYGRFIKPWLTASVGTGFNYYEEAIVPVFAQVRAYYPKWVSAPYVSMQAGYGVLAEKVFNQHEHEVSRGGWFWQPTLGVRLASKSKLATHFSIGYRVQPITYAYEYPEGWWRLSEKNHLRYKSLVFRVGFNF